MDDAMNDNMMALEPSDEAHPHLRRFRRGAGGFGCRNTQAGRGFVHGLDRGYFDLVLHQRLACRRPGRIDEGARSAGAADVQLQ